ncbi:hypothetical protein EV102420_16_00410 [Pseudescherichia vulneris NBRC 102420]|uniref:Uncharacterized protein n=1 Tax=Pseudescherichia vulneris NBRC 102420 TaxID=1115515 RepID=A0A090VVV5_PSEVU|nr:hypothetical protein EV102420_16_00410 [Pseudescherichia vulneris NBRC 102420]
MALYQSDHAFVRPRGKLRIEVQRIDGKARTGFQKQAGFTLCDIATADEQAVAIA